MIARHSSGAEAMDSEQNEKMRVELRLLRKRYHAEPLREAEMRNVVAGLAFLLLIAPLLGDNVLVAQTRPGAVVIADTPCTRCEVTATVQAVLDGRTVPLRGLPSGAALDSRGRITLWYFGATGGLPMVFDSTGKLLGEIGRRGTGPGEFLSVSWVTVGTGDTVYVYSPTGAVSVFSPDMSHVRTRQGQGATISAFNHVRLRDSRTVALSRVFPQGQPDLSPIALLDSAGKLVRHLRPNPGPVRPVRRLASASSGRPGIIWVAESGRAVTGYLAMLVDSLGNVPRTYQRIPSWWTEGAVSKGEVFFPDTVLKPPTQVAGIREDRDGRLLILATQPRHEWKTVRSADVNREGNFFSILEVVDPGRGHVVGTARVPGYGIAVLSDTRFATYHEDADGFPFVRLWTVRIGAPR